MTKANVVHLVTQPVGLGTKVKRQVSIKVVYEDRPREPDALVSEIETERGVEFTQQVRSRMLEAAAGTPVIDQA